MKFNPLILQIKLENPQRESVIFQRSPSRYRMDVGHLICRPMLVLFQPGCPAGGHGETPAPQAPALYYVTASNTHRLYCTLFAV